MRLIVKPDSSNAATGTLELSGLRKVFPCTLGRGGVVAEAAKVEGDGATPIGVYALREVFYRADKVSKPDTRLPLHELTSDIGWCENPDSPHYNRRVHASSVDATDKMFYHDHVYDIVVVIGYNDDPVVKGKGSAIFMHHARPDFTPTAGCIGLKPEDMREVLRHLSPSSLLEVRPPAP